MSTSAACVAPPSETSRDAVGVTWHLVVTLGLLFAGVVPWRSNAYFEGSLDSVVLAKAGVIFAAALLALYPPGSRSTARSLLPAGPVCLVTAYLGASLVGALTGGSIVASGIVAVRVAVVAFTLAVLAATYGADTMTRGLARVFVLAFVVATITGLGEFRGGRLRGGVPPLHFNELALVAAVCLVWVLGKVMRAQERAHDYLAIVVLAGVLYATGSRTTMLATLLAVLAMTMRAQRFTIGGLVAASCSIPVFAYLLVGTDVITSVLDRGGTESLTTLSNRTIAWNAAINAVGDWLERLFGRGLAVKHVEVAGQWWPTQILDSSWVSALVQAGWVGLVIGAGWLVVAVWRAGRSHSVFAAVWLGWIVCIGVRAFLESGLLDASASFLILWTVSLACWLPAARTSGRPALGRGRHRR